MHQLQYVAYVCTVLLCVIPNRVMADSSSGTHSKAKKESHSIQILHSIQLKSAITAVAYSPKATHIAYALGDHDGAVLFNLGTRMTTVLRLPRSGVTTALRFSPDGKSLAIGTDRGVVALWNQSVREMAIGKVRHNGSAVVLAFSDDGKLLASGGELAGIGHPPWIQVWKVSTLEHETTLKGHKDTISGITFTNSGRSLAGFSIDGVLLLWNLKSGLKKQLYSDPPQKFGSVFSGGKSHLFLLTNKSYARLTSHGWTSSGRPTVRQIEVPSTKAKVILTFGGYFDCATLSSNRRRLAVANPDGAIEIWSIRSRSRLVRKDVHTPPVLQPGRAIVGIAFGPNGDRVVSAGNDGWIRVMIIKGIKSTQKPKNDTPRSQARKS